MRITFNREGRGKTANHWQTKFHRFLTREDGSIVVVSLFLIPMMLILGGMAVDFMRFENRRTVIQDTADRAALLAANLRFTEKDMAAAAVEDYFAKAGLDEYLVLPVKVSDADNERTVEVNVTQPLNTFFLKLVGIDALDANAHSIATQGVGDVEISLVLDVSGSMDETTTNAQGNEITKLAALQTAAESFVRTALQDQNLGSVSISLVPYSEQVGIGSNLFNRLNTTQEHDYSHCIDFEEADYSTTGLDLLSRTYKQTQHFDKHSTGSGEAVVYPLCPLRTNEQITAVSQNRDALVTQISNLQTVSNTAVYIGVKWGTALLDPSVRTLVAPDLDVEMQGRPFDYNGSSRKVMVVMTDGQNILTRRIKPEFYANAGHILHWANNAIPGWVADNTVNIYDETNPLSFLADFMDVLHTVEQGDDLLEDACAAARDQNIQIFAVAFEAGTAGQAAMLNCAGDTNNYFNANGSNLNAVFLAIADQVTNLRLTQ